MASKVKATVAIDHEIFDMVEQESRQRHETRSAIIEEALRYWKNSKLEQALAQGYQAMAEEDRATAEKHFSLFKEVIS